MLPLASNVTVANSEARLQLSVAQVSANWDQYTQSNRGAQMHSGIHNGLKLVDGTDGYRAPVGSYVEAKCLFPGNGSFLHNWSALWTCAEGWPTGGEHDILEALQFNATLGSRMYAVYHYGLDGGPNKRSTEVWNDQGNYMGDRWIVAGVHRKATTADYYWDDVKVATIPTSDNGLAHAIVLTTGVGYHPPRSPVLGLPGAMRVDWVRSWHPEV